MPPDEQQEDSPISRWSYSRVPTHRRNRRHQLRQHAIGPLRPAHNNLGQRRQAAPLRLHYNGVGFSVDGFDLDLHRAPAHRHLGRIHRADEPATRQLQLRGRPDPLRHRVAAMRRRPGHKPHRRAAAQHRRHAVHPILHTTYNTPQCSAAANLNYLAGGPSNTSGFTWTLWLGGTASKNARLFVGLPGEFRRRMWLAGWTFIRI
ncbi:uncharacterized protein F4817DRAFT_346587 [Daldinia loculata]|uniref:uncharacterized protein n=1 Tax=Daldinia loculata TaxID=103429 RepID=UPI0020C350AD|nr:uncharacterized protein F4817DRAFT_346587 [Daldinia loculata]KAI1644427.1 hypothetical protein F4817DRAFT_346587 [Daldinia loculata]